MVQECQHIREYIRKLFIYYYVFASNMACPNAHTNTYNLGYFSTIVWMFYECMIIPVHDVYAGHGLEFGWYIFFPSGFFCLLLHQFIFQLFYFLFVLIHCHQIGRSTLYRILGQLPFKLDVDYVFSLLYNQF